jgi:hypothetical protein
VPKEPRAGTQQDAHARSCPGTRSLPHPVFTTCLAPLCRFTHVTRFLGIISSFFSPLQFTATRFYWTSIVYIRTDAKNRVYLPLLHRPTTSLTSAQVTAPGAGTALTCPVTIFLGYKKGTTIKKGLIHSLLFPQPYSTAGRSCSEHSLPHATTYLVQGTSVQTTPLTPVTYLVKPPHL